MAYQLKPLSALQIQHAQKLVKMTQTITEMMRPYNTYFKYIGSSKREQNRMVDEMAKVLCIIGDSAPYAIRRSFNTPWYQDMRRIVRDVSSGKLAKDDVKVFKALHVYVPQVEETLYSVIKQEAS